MDPEHFTQNDWDDRSVHNSHDFFLHWKFTCNSEIASKILWCKAGIALTLDNKSFINTSGDNNYINK